MEFGSPDFYTNENLTDDIAEEYLKKYPDNVGYFAELPEDWEERIVGKAFDEKLLEEIVQAKKDGISDESIINELASSRVNGKRVTKNPAERVHRGSRKDCQGNKRRGMTN